MAALAFTRKLSSMRSRKARLRATGNQGVRKWSRTRSTKGGGIQNLFKNWGGRLVGWINSGLNELKKRLSKISVTQIFQALVNTGNLLLNFNFQVTDTEIDKQIDAINKSIVTRGFGAVGRTLGSTICGLGGAALITKFNPSLGYHVMSNVAPEVAEELLSEWSQALSQAATQYATAKALEFFKGARKFLKDPNNPFGQVLRKLVGDKTIDEWGNPGNKEWTFKKGVGNLVKRVIKDEELLENLQEGWEEFSDACIDAGFMIAGSIDDWIGMQSWQREGLLGRTRTIQVTPNREVPSETVILTGTEQNLRTATTEIIATSQLLNNRDIGTQIIGEDNEPIITNNGISVTLEFYAYSQPPYNTNERIKEGNARSRLTIPNCDPLKLNWDNIKTLFGGKNKSHDKGDIFAEARLDNGRKLKSWVDSEPEGVTLLEKMARISKADIILPIQFTSKRKYEGKGRIQPRKRRPQYLAYIHISNNPRITKYEALSNQKEVKASKGRIPMYYESKPSWVDDKIRDIVKKSGND
ncbi:MAG: hypothetical protein F6K40_39285 [Okeania sp. SIO3I5]|nr:hypothetical protein [Okeania sp. SIO3I5]